MWLLIVHCLFGAASQPASQLGVFPPSDAAVFADKPDVAELKRYVAARPGSPLAPRARLLIGLEQLKAGVYDEAASYLEQAKADLPEISDVVVRKWAEALVGAG